MRGPYNRLDNIHTHKLNLYVVEHADNLRRFRNHKERAVIATEDLGFNVTGANIANSCEATGVQFAPPKPEKIDLKALAERVAELERKLAWIEAPAGTVVHNAQH